MLPPVELLLGGELAVDQQIGDLQERGVLDQVLDQVAAVGQDPGASSMLVIELMHEAVWLKPGS